jgi:DNA replication regulator SLD3
LGGPSQSPDKRGKSATKHPREPKSVKPMTLSKESESQAKKQAPRSLQKTSSVSNPKKGRPVFARSATDTDALIPTIKREGSEKPSLHSIPLLQEQERKPRRDSLASLKHLQARQINLSSITTSSSADNKRKRKAAKEEDIQDAINSIKKPNRTEASREAADERDRRVAKVKSKGQPRNSLGGRASGADRKALKPVENVQVLATPHHGRKIDVFSQPVVPALHTDDHFDALPSSALKSHISDSVPGTVKESEPRVQARKLQPAIHETPSKAPPRQRLFTSPERMEEVPDSTSKGPLIATEAPDIQGIECTPLKPTSRSQVDFACPSTPLPTKKAKSASIYDTLGWNDYDVDD